MRSFSRPFDKCGIEGEGAMSYAKCCAVLHQLTQSPLLCCVYTTVISLYTLTPFTLSTHRCYYYPHLQLGNLETEK